MRLIKWVVAMVPVFLCVVVMFVGCVAEAVWEVLTEWADR